MAIRYSSRIKTTAQVRAQLDLIVERKDRLVRLCAERVGALTLLAGRAISLPEAMGLSSAISSADLGSDSALA